MVVWVWFAASEWLVVIDEITDSELYQRILNENASISVCGEQMAKYIFLSFV